MGNTVASILRSKPYIGTLVNHRRTSKSFKNKKIIQIPEDEWIEVENTHEAIIDRETWDIVQKMVAVKKRPNKDGVSQIFAGLVKCPDCGRALSYKSEHTRILRVALSTITPRTKARNTVLGTLYQIVLTDIQLHTALLKKDRAKFEEALQIHLSSQNKKQLASLKKEQNKLQKRFAELGQITKKLYEDNALSRISDEEYARLSVEFINERSQVEERLSTIDEELKKEERNLQKVTSFTAVIEKYLDIKELNKTVLNELIDKLKSTKQKRSTAKESKRLISITDSSAT